MYSVRTDARLTSLSHRIDNTCIHFIVLLFYLESRQRLQLSRTMRKHAFMSYANNKGADQPAHPRSLISAFFVRCLDSTNPLVSMFEIASL